MGKRQKEWARKKRQALIKQLGGKCVSCGTKRDLEFDHKDPATRTWNNKYKDQSARISIYTREIKEDLIQLLCDTCNSLKRWGKLPF